jgi:hypothetical protein
MLSAALPLVGLRKSVALPGRVENLKPALPREFHSGADMSGALAAIDVLRDRCHARPEPPLVTCCEDLLGVVWGCGVAHARRRPKKWEPSLLSRQPLGGLIHEVRPREMDPVLRYSGRSTAGGVLGSSHRPDLVPGDDVRERNPHPGTERIRCRVGGPGGPYRAQHLNAAASAFARGSGIFNRGLCLLASGFRHGHSLDDYTGSGRAVRAPGGGAQGRDLLQDVETAGNPRERCVTRGQLGVLVDEEELAAARMRLAGIGHGHRPGRVRRARQVLVGDRVARSPGPRACRIAALKDEDPRRGEPVQTLAVELTSKQYQAPRSATA